MKITLWSVIALRSKVEQVLMSCGSFSARQGAPEKRTVKWEVDSTAPLRARTLTLDLADCTCSRARSTRQHSWRLEQGASNSEAERGTHTHTRGCGACRSPSKCSTFGGGDGGQRAMSAVTWEEAFFCTTARSRSRPGFLWSYLSKRVAGVWVVVDKFEEASLLAGCGAMEVHSRLRALMIIWWIVQGKRSN